MKRSFYNTQIVADRYYDDVYLWEGEVLFLKGFLTNSYQDHSYANDVISLNLHGVVEGFFKNSAWYALSKLQCYKEMFDFDIGLNIDIKDKQLKVFLERNKQEPKKYKKQKRLLTLLKKYNTLSEIVKKKEILRLLDDKDIKSSAGIIFVTFNNISKLKEDINWLLNDYLNRYEAGELSFPGKRIYSKFKHFDLFYALLKDFKDYDLSSLCISRYDFVGAAKKHIGETSDISEFRLTEFLLFLERYGFLKIKGLGIKWFSSVSEDPKWEIDIEVLKNAEEIKEIQSKWLRYGRLGFRPDIGLAVNGSLKRYTFDKKQDGYHVIKLFLEGNKKKFTIEEIYDACCKKKEVNKKEDKKTKVENVMHHGIMDKLNMNSPESKIMFVGKEDSYELVIVP